MTTHSSILAWKIQWTEEPGRLQSMGPQSVGHEWATAHTPCFTLSSLNSVVGLELPPLISPRPLLRWGVIFQTVGFVNRNPYLSMMHETPDPLSCFWLTTPNLGNVVPRLHTKKWTPNKGKQNKTSCVVYRHLTFYWHPWLSSFQSWATNSNGNFQEVFMIQGLLPSVGPFFPGQHHLLHLD